MIDLESRTIDLEQLYAKLGIQQMSKSLTKEIAEYIRDLGEDRLELEDPRLDTINVFFEFLGS